ARRSWSGWPVEHPPAPEPRGWLPQAGPADKAAPAPPPSDAGRWPAAAAGGKTRGYQGPAPAWYTMRPKHRSARPLLPGAGRACGGDCLPEAPDRQEEAG